ncbi:putative NAD/FAD-dependent oxidoreductase [Nostoc sp. PCC 7524]|uniref:NAD(P)/FAD-dependent oxidoreductase n=1 Tax=Nostoc sp. (strain ATCC 29411 / PCC 7524) TaxID=28072 RepID=UPI00029F285E|nr:NAD(P)/FAD-dependent oxidoreductase [Nostoc sp. PCC 7524]AFY47500.1 putative NAD/FAD-dependent oxidoreductase [Nostoc sp. PCC 7524]
MNDVVVIGAGMAGLICAQQLNQAGYSVLVVDKSRGLGGRLATRRLYETRADHGACYLKPKGELFTDLVNLLCDRQILEVWTDTVYEFTADTGLSAPQNRTPRYVAPAGMSAIAKFLAQGLNILLNQRVTAINLTSENSWRLTLESGDEELTAKALVIAIPAPQALMLLQPLGAGVLGKQFLEHLRSVEFYPCISVMSGYPATSSPLPDWKAISFTDDAVLGWIGLDSSKRHQSPQPVFVVQSSANFAQIHLDSSDLQPLGQQIVQYAAQILELPWLDQPEWLQVHRWRYAFPRHPWQHTVLSAPAILPLVCCGDWCGGNLVEGAMLSGLAASIEINHQLDQLLLPDVNFFKVFTQ